MSDNSFSQQVVPEDIQDEGTASPVVEGEAQIDFDAVKPAETPEQVDCPACEEARQEKLRALADLENTRKRLQREKEDFLKYASESVIADILPAIDNLDLALAYIPEDPAAKNFAVGVDMTRKLLLDSLGRHGLQTVGILGEEFDPALHEAMGTEENPQFANGQICKLLSKGYRLKERLLRPAKVMVCKNETQK